MHEIIYMYTYPFNSEYIKIHLEWKLKKILK